MELTYWSTSLIDMISFQKKTIRKVCFLSVFFLQRGGLKILLQTLYLLYFVVLWSCIPWTKWDLTGPPGMKSSCRQRSPCTPNLLVTQGCVPSPHLLTYNFLVLRSMPALEAWHSHLPCLGISEELPEKAFPRQNRTSTVIKPGKS